MILHPARLSLTSPPVRAIAAAALASSAGLAFYLRYRGDCMIPNDFDITAFVTLTGLFFGGFVWLIAELALPHMPPAWPATLRTTAATATGLLTYATIGFAVWLSAPDTMDTPGSSFRAFTSIAWIAGILIEAGTFTYYSCGY